MMKTRCDNIARCHCMPNSSERDQHLSALLEKVKGYCGQGQWAICESGGNMTVYDSDSDRLSVLKTKLHCRSEANISN